MIQEHIYQLLLDNDCVVVPGLGGFICQYHAAAVDLKKGIISPPGRSVAFNKALQQNDGLLIQKISVEDKIAFKEAEDKVRSFVNQCNLSLHQHGSYVLMNIGRLYMDELKHIQFSPSVDLLPLQEAFGLQAISVKPITRLKDAAKEPEINQVVELSGRTHSTTHQQRSWPYWLAASFAVVFLSSTLWINGSQPGISEYVKAGFTFNEVETSIATDIIEPSVSKEIIASSPVMTEVTATSTETISTEAVATSSFAVVVGAFKGPITANKLADELKMKGFQSEVILPEGNQWLKVVIHVPAVDELTALRTVRAEVEPDAWLLQ